MGVYSIYALVLWSWGKHTQQVLEKPGQGKVNAGQNLFGSRRTREKRHIFLLVLQAEGNESYRNVGTASLTEANPTTIWETRLRESKPRSKLVWVHKAVFIFWAIQAEGRGAYFLLQSLGKHSPVRTTPQWVFGGTRLTKNLSQG